MGMAPRRKSEDSGRKEGWGARLRRLGLRSMGVLLVASTMATLSMFPWDTDPEGDESEKTRKYYREAYATGGVASAPPPGSLKPLSEKEQFYIDFARNAAAKGRIPEKVRGFVERFGLQNKRVLEVGAGSGLLQDMATDYTALDISPTARRFFHKPFVEASATDMPFPDNSFDALWSIWVLEHIPNPEKALLEMRRVVKPGGYLFLHPAFDVSRYTAQGYAVRPYSDFDWWGKAVKASIPVSESRLWNYLQARQVRMIRSLQAHLMPPARLHFTRLTPNYEQYWQADSDATTGLAPYELYLWFTTRGDRCIDCPSEPAFLLRSVGVESLTIQVQKAR